MTVETYKLNNGAELPLLGLGTWQAKDTDELSASLRTALDNGYRLIDTAYLYQNEHIIGEILSEYISNGRIKREELFITTKLPFMAHDPEDVPTVVAKSLEALKLDYVDLYLIHCPCPFAHQEDSLLPKVEDGAFVPTVTTHLATWKALEEQVKAGKLKAIGLSNFNADQVQAIYDAAEIKPANLQVECHIYWPQFELHDVCKKLNISFTAYAPLGSPGRKAARPDGVWPEGDPLVDPIVLSLAEKYHKTAAQILLRHLTQRGISVIPKSVQPERVIENISIFDFKLSDEDLHQLDTVATRIRLFVFDFAAGHPFFPYDDVDQSKLPRVALKLH